MELLAAMRLELAQEFSQNVEITQLLQCPIIQPQEALFERVRGCDQHCPLCRAPCELQEGHELHKALLHRPKDMLPHDSGMTEGNPDMSKDKQDLSVACSSLHSLQTQTGASPMGTQTLRCHVLIGGTVMFINV